ncbi:MAG: hypothetical protein MZV70_20170 [Desulfobacterales bacterium]|nr:hypothetical protein [Desulfobacterales bacterium]
MLNADDPRLRPLAQGPGRRGAALRPVGGCRRAGRPDPARPRRDSISS